MVIKNFICNIHRTFAPDISSVCPLCIMHSVQTDDVFSWTAKGMVSDAQKKIYVLDGNVPVLVNRSTMEETLDVEAKSHVEMFHQTVYTLYLS